MAPHDDSAFAIPDHMPPTTRLAKSCCPRQVSEGEESMWFLEGDEVEMPNFDTDADNCFAGFYAAPPGLEDMVPAGLLEGGSIAFDQSCLEESDGDLKASRDGVTGCNTLMVKNIPSTYRQIDTAEIMRKAGFGDKIDFLYLPAHIKGGNRGFAFINFTSVDAAEDFFEKCNGRFDLFGVSKANRPLAILPANLQGLKANVENLIYHRFWHSWQEPPMIFDALYAAAFQATMQTKPASIAKPVKASKPQMKPSLEKLVTVRHEDDFAAPVGIKSSTFRIALHRQIQQPARVNVPRVRLFCEFCGGARPTGAIFCPFCGDCFTTP